MELRHLRYFVVVAEEQNVTRAAERLHVSQPPLSRQIRDLEEELGVAFPRTAKSLALTEAGKLFLGEARAILFQVDKAVEAVRTAARGERGRLRIGYAPSLTVGLLPQALRTFERERPGVRVALLDLSSEECLRRLAEKKIDLALTVEPTGRRKHGLVFENRASSGLLRGGGGASAGAEAFAVAGATAAGTVHDLFAGGLSGVLRVAGGILSSPSVQTGGARGVRQRDGADRGGGGVSWGGDRAGFAAESGGAGVEAVAVDAEGCAAEGGGVGGATGFAVGGAVYRGAEAGGGASGEASGSTSGPGAGTFCISGNARNSLIASALPSDPCGHCSDRTYASSARSRIPRSRK
jgi:DNA-binding transcriptional LysR family regulator